MKCGEIRFGEGSIVINQGRRTISLRVKNVSCRPIWVSSHYHFFEVNRRLLFERERALGMRLDIPAGSSVYFAPGEEKQVRLVEIAGRREVWGFNGLVNGPLATQEQVALQRARERGFLLLQETDDEP